MQQRLQFTAPFRALQIIVSSNNAQIWRRRRYYRGLARIRVIRRAGFVGPDVTGGAAVAAIGHRWRRVFACSNFGLEGKKSNILGLGINVMRKTKSFSNKFMVDFE